MLSAVQLPFMDDRLVELSILRSRLPALKGLPVQLDEDLVRGILGRLGRDIQMWIDSLAIAPYRREPVFTWPEFGKLDLEVEPALALHEVNIREPVESLPECPEVRLGCAPEDRSLNASRPGPSRSRPGHPVERGLGGPSLDHQIRHLVGVPLVSVPHVPDPTRELDTAALLDHVRRFMRHRVEI